MNATHRLRGTAILLPLLPAILFLLAACSRNTVSLDFTSAKDEVPQLGNLSFRFSEPLATDSMLNRWDSTEYISFEPAIEGRFRWESRNQLVFSPSAPLAPATTYKAQFNKSVLKNTGFSSVKDADKISFHTPDLALENTHVFWMLNAESNSPTPQVDLYFNYKVDPKLLQEKLHVHIDGKDADYALVTVSNEEKISAKLLQVPTEDRDYKISFSIAKGLVPERGKNGTAEQSEQEVVLGSPYVLNIGDINAEHDGIQGRIVVKCSQPLVPAQFSQFITLSPSVVYTTELTEDGIIISSDQFSAESSYTLSFKPGMRGVVGGVLKETYTNTVAFGQLEPSISFASNNAMYLGKQGAKNIEVRIANIPKVKVVVSKIYESNLLLAENYGYYPKETNGDEEGDYYDEGNANLVLGDVVYEKEIDTRSLPKYGSGRLFQFNIPDALASEKGVYHIKIRSTEDYWLSDSRFISLSDIGLIAKVGAEKMVVFANSIQTAKPMNGVTVQVYGANNQLMGKATTNNDGMAEMPIIRQEISGFKPAMVVAKLADDFNYLPFHKTGVNVSRFEVGGKRLNNTGLDVFAYAERDIYRPGEKMNFAIVVRNNQWQSPGSMPVKMKMLLPNGKELANMLKNLDANGAAEGNLQLSESAITGTYVLEVYNGNDVLLTSKNFKVETFMPDRIRLHATLDKTEGVPGQPLNLSIQAANYFGPPAAGRKFECEIQVKPKRFAPAKYDRFDFELGSQPIIFEKVLRQGVTNEAGFAAAPYEVPALYKNLGLLEANFFTTVFDETGRPVNKFSSAKIYTQPVMFGIGNAGNNYYALNQPVRFPIIALNKLEQPVTATAQVQVIKHEYRTVLTKSGSYFRYDSQRDTKVVASATVQVSGESAYFPFIPRTPGEYELRIAPVGADSYVSQHFYSYGAWGNAEASFEVNREGNIDIALDKTLYAKGETVKALFKTPFNGRMLVTVETDKVVHYQYVDVVNKNASIQFKVDDAWLPNAYISATLFKPHGVSDMPLTVAHGFKNIATEDNAKRMAVSITAAKNVRSKTRQVVKVKAAPNAMVTLSAVDNGVLAVSNFRTPDPYQYFFSQRALGVRAFDLYPLLFPELRRIISSSGGDADLELSQRQNPMPDKRIKFMSFWSGIQQTNGSGEVSFTVDIPQFSGEVRLMAVACKANTFGAAESTITVADPLVISSALPRFVSPSDTMLVPVTISNTTKADANVSVKLITQGGLQVVGGTTATLPVAAKKEGQTTFKLYAGPTIGNGTVKVEVSGLGEKFTETTELTIRPASTLQKMSGAVVLSANTQQRIDIGVSDFIPQSVQYNLTVSRSPLLQLGSQLQYLVQYPYGCTEQTISVAFPQLYFSDLSALVHNGNGLQRSSVENVQEAIRKIKMRQLYNGAVSLWEGESQENWWTSAYAAHFLIEAKKAGFEVDKSLLETLLGYLNVRLRNKETVIYTYNRNLQKKIAPKEVAYSLYVMALAGRPNIAAMNYYKANNVELAIDSRFLLSAAFTLAGDKLKAKELLPSSFAGEESVAQTGGSFYSDIRDESVSLNALLDADPSNPQIAIMARHVADKLKARQWYTTQECAFSFIAMGKIARKAVQNNATATVQVNGKTVGSMNGAALKLTQAQLGGTQAVVTTKGNGPLYAWWQSQGISASGAYKEEDSYLKVRRSFYDRNGKPISGNRFKQNDLVIVKLSLEKSYSGTVENVVVTDILPAGFEIENARIKELPGTEWIKDASQPNHMDMRDDRVHFFTNLSSKQQFYFSVRAVSAGTFRMGPVSADAMYNAEYHSYHGAATIYIQR